jgi:hypothetical protein
MLDLGPIKARLNGVSRGLSLGDAWFIDPLDLNHCDAKFVAHSVYDVLRLVEEVERLQKELQDATRRRFELVVAIQTHKHEAQAATTVQDLGLATAKLWEVLDA